MAYISFSRDHILKRIEERYNPADSEIILERVIASITTQAPEDWRFTESFTARFFIVDFPSKVKILGLSYRDCGGEIVSELQHKIAMNQVAEAQAFLEQNVRRYIDCLLDPDKKIVHDLRTAYPKTGGEIGEEKRVFLAVREQLSHIVPLKAKKIAARPNAIIMENNELWVRQHLNWVDLRDANIEYLFFMQLTPKGINKARQKIFQYSISGDLKEINLKGCKVNEDICCNESMKDLIPSSRRYRTETYWMLPTYLDLIFMDLQYRERNQGDAETGPLNTEDLALLYFLRKVIERAEQRCK